MATTSSKNVIAILLNSPKSWKATSPSMLVEEVKKFRKKSFMNY